MRRGLTALGTLVILLILAGAAHAHEQRQVGKYTLEVGWRDEPALEGALNAVQVEIRETATGKGIEGLTNTLRVLVSFGGSGQTFEPTLEATAGEPGTYTGAIIPTRIGDYIFRVTGTIDRLTFDERFESGPGRFGVVRSPSSLQFPDQIGSDPALARDLADQTRLVAYAALGVGLAALAVVVLSRRRRATSSRAASH